MEREDKRLLELGWGGELTFDEAQYIQSEIQKNRSLRRKWGFRGKGRVPLVKIAEKAFPENPKYAREHIVRGISRNARRKRKLTIPCI